MISPASCYISKVLADLPGPVNISGKREFSLRDQGEGIYTLDLKKGEEVLLYSDNTYPDIIIKPLPAQKNYQL